MIVSDCVKEKTIWICDPLGEGSDATSNLYVYVDGDPINFLDPVGLYHFVNGAHGPFTPGMDAALQCFDICTGRDTAITSGVGNRGRQNSSHSRGEACDIGRRSNPDLPRPDAERCFQQCFPGGYAQEERNGAGVPGTHYHFQMSPVPGGRPGLRALEPFREGSSLTKVGRALTKHPELIGETKGTLRQVLRTDEAINAAAQSSLKSIFRNGVATTPTVGRYGTITQIQIPGGFGARFYPGGDFIGFINPL